MVDTSPKSKAWTKILDWEFVLSEGNGYHSREQRTAAPQTADVLPGTLMGTITAAGATKGQITPWDPTAADGSQTITDIQGVRLPTSTRANRTATIARSAEVNNKKLIYGKATTDVQKAAARTALAAMGILIRD